MSTGTVTPLGSFSQQAASSLLAGPFNLVPANVAINPHVPARYVITKATAAALTLGPPTAGVDDGVLLSFLSTTGAAHTITTPVAGDIRDGNTSDHDTVMTFNSHIGASCILLAYQGVWYVLNEVGCSLSS